MRRRLWYSSVAVVVMAVLIVGVPALVIAAPRGAAALVVLAGLMVAAAALAAWLTRDVPTALLAGGYPPERPRTATSRRRGRLPRLVRALSK